MNNAGTLATLALVAGVALDSQAEELTFSYFEVTGDLSRTENTAAAPLDDNADGRFFGIEGSWEVMERFYVKGSWSNETKEFSNEVARTPLNLDSEQRTLAFGGGYYQPIGTAKSTSWYGELMYLADFTVDHLVPLVTPQTFGPPMVTTTDSTIEGNGFSAALGLRRSILENVEIEGQFAWIQTSADISRTGESISDSESMLRAKARWYIGNELSIGAFASFSKHTDNNFDNIQKIGVSLRYDFSPGGS